MNPLEASLLPASILARLRELRLWHWEKCQVNRRVVNLVEGCEHQTEYKRMVAENCHKKADFHMKQVQLLNEFFPVGDTAEGDDK